jgi:hypothetical protein
MNEDGERVVTVLPISHTPPADSNLAVEIPAPVERRLKLDDERSWVVLTPCHTKFPLHRRIYFESRLACIFLLCWLITPSLAGLRSE